MFNIILIGMPGSGKTTVGRILADKISAHFIDTDHLVEERVGLPVEKIFGELGEHEFRKLEKSVIQALADTTNTVIATGGGVVLDSDNWALLSALGKTIYLSTTPAALVKRLSNDDSRPLLQDQPDLKKYLTTLLEARADAYQKAAFTVETGRVEPREIAERILKMITH